MSQANVKAGPLDWLTGKLFPADASGKYTAAEQAFLNRMATNPVLKLANESLAREIQSSPERARQQLVASGMAANDVQQLFNNTSLKAEGERLRLANEMRDNVTKQVIDQRNAATGNQVTLLDTKTKNALAIQDPQYRHELALVAGDQAEAEKHRQHQMAMLDKSVNAQNRQQLIGAGLGLIPAILSAFV